MRIPLLLAAAAVLLPTPASAQGSPVGTWRNARDSVRIRVSPCASGTRALCGTVVSADADAQASAAAAGTERLVGTPLFRGLAREDDGLWHGEVFVPDLGTTVEGTIELRRADTLVASGCLFGSFGCKSQVWTRVGAR